MSLVASVIIPTHDRRDQLLQSVGALLEQELPEAWEVLVCCDRCHDGTEHAVRASFGSRVRIVAVNGQGQTAACNAGMNAAQGRILIFLDDDMEVQPGWLRAHLAAHSGSSTPGVAIGFSEPVLPVDATPLQLRVAAEMRRLFDELGRPDHRFTPADMTGGNFSVPRAVLLNAGGFDEEFVFARNDFELAARLLQTGIRFRFVREALTRTLVSLNGDAMLRRMPEKARNEYRLVQRYPWCREHIPYYEPRPGRRCKRRLLWATAPVLAPLAAAVRTIAPENLTLLNLACLAAYNREARSQIGSWARFAAMARPDVPELARRESA